MRLISIYFTMTLFAGGVFICLVAYHAPNQEGWAVPLFWVLGLSLFTAGALRYTGACLRIIPPLLDNEKPPEKPSLSPDPEHPPVTLSPEFGRAVARLHALDRESGPEPGNTP